MFERRKGTAATRDFYNRVGWRRQNGALVDTLLFGWADGPIHQALDSQRRERLLQAAGGPDLRLAELGCGGTPAIFLAERCTKFIAVDFSSTGLSEAAAALKGTNVAFETVEADITDLPFVRSTWSTQPTQSTTSIRRTVRRPRCGRRCASSGPAAGRYSSWRTLSRFCSPIGLFVACLQ